MNFHLTPSSSNRKTGPIPVSSTSPDSCPPSCPFMGNGCYASTGPIALHWSKLKRGVTGCDFATFLKLIAALPAGQFWRHNQAGDLPGVGERINARQLGALVKANAGKRGFTYTHKQCTGTSAVARSNANAVRMANQCGFTVNLSGNSPAHADELKDLEAGPVVCVVPIGTPKHSTTPAGRPVTICPAQRIEGMTCNKCRLCSLPNREIIIGFLPHGTQSKKANAIASN